MALFVVQSALLAGLFADWLNAASTAKPLTGEGLRTLLPWIIGCWLLRPVLSLIKEHLLQNLSLDIRHYVRCRLLEALAKLGPAKSRFGSDGALSTQMLEQVDALDGYISRFYVQRTVAVATPLLIAVAVFFHSKLAAVLLLATAPLVPLFMVLVGKAAAGKSREQLDTLAQLGGRFLDLVRGMPTLRRLHSAGGATGLGCGFGLSKAHHERADFGIFVGCGAGVVCFTGDCAGGGVFGFGVDWRTAVGKRCDSRTL